MKRKILLAIIAMLLFAAATFYAINVVVRPSPRGILKLYCDEECRNEVSKVYFAKHAGYTQEFISINVYNVKNVGDDTIVLYGFNDDHPSFHASIEYSRPIDRLLPKENLQISFKLYLIEAVPPGIYHLNLIFTTNFGDFSFPAEVAIPPKMR